VLDLGVIRLYGLGTVCLRNYPQVPEYIGGFGLEQAEHGDREPTTDVTASDPIVTGKIALAHLNEFPDYNTRLARLEAEAEDHWRGMPAPEPPAAGVTARDVALILGAVGATAGSAPRQPRRCSRVGGIAGCASRRGSRRDQSSDRCGR